MTTWHLSQCYTKLLMKLQNIKLLINDNMQPLLMQMFTKKEHKACKEKTNNDNKTVQFIATKLQNGLHDHGKEEIIRPKR